MIWSTRHKFKVGDRVRHVATGQIRTIFALDPTVDESYKLDEKVDGFYHWSTFDLELVDLALPPDPRRVGKSNDGEGPTKNRISFD